MQPNRHDSPGGSPYPLGTMFFQLVVPVTELGAGGFRFDPLEKLLGQPLAHILQPAMTGPMHRRISSAGQAVNVYPLQLPPGEGVSIRLGSVGEIGFRNVQGYLEIAAPWPMHEWLRQRLAPWLVRGPEPVQSMDGTAWVAVVWIRLTPGMRASMPLPVVGEVGLEVG